MSGYGYDGYDEDDDDQNDTGDGPVGLRQHTKQLEKQVKALTKQLQEKDTLIADLSNKSRGATLAEILRSKQVNPKLANLIPASVDASEEAVSKFLEDYADLFPVQKPEPPKGDQAEQEQQLSGDEVDEDEQALQQGWDEAQRALSGARPQGDAVNFAKKLEEIGSTAKSFDEAAAALGNLPGVQVGGYAG